MSSRKSSSAPELASAARDFRAGILRGIDGKSVTLRCRDIATYVEALTALDGWASRILLVDDEFAPELLGKFEDALAIEFRITTASKGLDVEALKRHNPTMTTGTEWVIPTSGTTGEPKLIAHSFPSLARTVKTPNEASSKLRWGLLYNPTRFAGLQVILQAVGGGSGLVVPDHPADLKNSILILQANGCNALSATPSLWRKLAFSDLLEILDLKVVTLGGEAADQKILDTLRLHYPVATIRHIYASTEAGVGFSVSDGKVGFPADYLQNPPPGIELKLGDNGILMLRPAQRDQRMLSNESPLIDDEGWISSGDLVEIREDRCHFLGRMNGSINVGGQKVHPSEVENVLMETPGVLAARVFGKPNPVLGALVAAEIVAEPGTDQAALRARIMERCKLHLQRYKTPALISFKEDFELTSAGKLKR
jgi:acyl-CoA synthetase (AMP-forming)/AMP-acid ligase II